MKSLLLEQSVCLNSLNIVCLLRNEGLFVSVCKYIYIYIFQKVGREGVHHLLNECWLRLKGEVLPPSAVSQWEGNTVVLVIGAPFSSVG